jgi:hypothetical protein
MHCDSSLYNYKLCACVLASVEFYFVIVKMAEMLMDETELSRARYFSELFSEGITRCSEFLNCLREDLRVLYGQDISSHLGNMNWRYNEMRVCGFLMGLGVEEEMETVSGVEILRLLGLDFTTFLSMHVNCSVLWEEWGNDEELNLEITCGYISRIYGPVSESWFKRLIRALQFFQPSLQQCVESVLIGKHGNFCDWGFAALQLEEEYHRQWSPIDWESVRNDNNNV